MSEHLRKAITHSAQIFRDTVWPVIRDWPIVGGGELEPVEERSDYRFAKVLDTQTGIDAWQVHNYGVRGIASRVQYILPGGEPYNSFTVRIKCSSGRVTEIHKRLDWLAHPEEGWLGPHLTVQAYVIKGAETLLSVAVVPTRVLIPLVCDHGMNLPPNKFDGTQGRALYWCQVSALDPDNIEGHDTTGDWRRETAYYLRQICNYHSSPFNPDATLRPPTPTDYNPFVNPTSRKDCGPQLQMAGLVAAPWNPTDEELWG